MFLIFTILPLKIKSLIVKKNFNLYKRSIDYSTYKVIINVFFSMIIQHFSFLFLMYFKLKPQCNIDFAYFFFFNI
jgi:hypothetical protein